MARLGTVHLQGVRGRDPDGATGRLGTLRRFVDTLLLAGVLAVFATGLVVARLPQPPTTTVTVAEVTGGAPAGTPGELTAAAADLLEATTAKGGTGFRFEIAQRSTLVARPDGPQIDIPDPIDRTKSLGFTDRYYLAGLVETGFATPAGFYAELRTGPAAPDAAVDAKGGEILYRALVTGGVTYRDDGDGWYPTDAPPGIGLDPRTAALLPRLLRTLAAPAELDAGALTSELLDPAPSARALGATAEIASIPGIIAVDGEEFTELTEPVALVFDAAGRLTGILVSARNTNAGVHDLVVVTEIAIRYDAVPIGLPDPVPAHPDPDAIVTTP